MAELENRKKDSSDNSSTFKNINKLKSEKNIDEKFSDTDYITQKEFEDFKKRNEDRLNRVLDAMDDVSDKQKRSTSNLNRILSKVLSLEKVIENLNIRLSIFTNNNDKKDENKSVGYIWFFLEIITISIVIYLIGKYW